MDPNELVRALDGQEIKNTFIEKPDFFAGLLCGLSPAVLSDTEVNKQLLYCLRSIIRVDDNLDYDIILNKVLHGESIHDAVTEFDTQEVVLKGINEVSVNGKKLIMLSGYFKNLAQGKQLPEVIDLKAYPEASTVLASLTMGNEIKLTEKNLLLMLEIASYYLIDSLTRQCDSYVNNSGIPKNVLEQWVQKQDKEVQDLSMPALKLKFCKHFDLKATKVKIIEELKTKLIKNPQYRPYLTEIALLPKKIQTEIFTNYQAKL